eukprot:gene3504-3838_t
MAKEAIRTTIFLIFFAMYAIGLKISRYGVVKQWGKASFAWRLTSAACVQHISPHKTFTLRSPFSQYARSPAFETNDGQKETEGNDVIGDSPPIQNIGNYKREQKVKVVVQSFGPLGASVQVEDSTDRSLVTQSEIRHYEEENGVKVRVGDLLHGYVSRVREDSRIDICLRPVGKERMNEIKGWVLDALTTSPSGKISVDDHSTIEDIHRLFPGVSKSEFKRAIGILYKERMIKIGSGELTFVPEDQRIVRPPSIFLGNLPSSINEVILRKALATRLDKDVIGKIRIVTDRETNVCKGYAFADLVSDATFTMQDALAKLKGLEVMGRQLRADDADNPRKKPVAEESKTKSMRFAKEVKSEGNSSRSNSRETEISGENRTKAFYLDSVVAEGDANEGRAKGKGRSSRDSFFDRNSQEREERSSRPFSGRLRESKR